MIFTGTFNTHDNYNTYAVTIGNTGVTTEITDPLDPDIYGEHAPDMTVMFGKEPVKITCDRQDLEKRIIISQATINLVSNANLTDYLFADTDRSIPVTIERVLDNNSRVSTFFGYVDPLQFDQGFAYTWEDVQLTATDPLGALQDLNVGDLSGYNSSMTKTPWQFLLDILAAIDISNDNVVSYVNDTVKNAMQNTNVKMLIMFGDSEDDWMSLDEALTEICKYFNLYVSFWDGKARITCSISDGSTYQPVEVAIPTDPNNPHSFRNSAADTSTSISVDDVYSQICLTCEIEPVPDAVVSPTDEDSLYSNWNNFEPYMTELVATGEGKSAYNGFYELLTTGTTTYYRDEKSYGYTLGNYVFVKRNNAWRFGDNSYITYMGGTEGDNPTRMSGNQRDVLKWLKQHPGKGALIGFGRDKKKNASDDSVVNSIEIKDYLIISICGHYKDTTAYADAMSNQIQANSPICSYLGVNSSILSPPDPTITNYLVISGNILLNPLVPLTGPYWANDAEKITNTKTACLNAFYNAWPQNQLYVFGHTVPSDINTDGQYYQQDWLSGSYDIYGDLQNSSNKRLQYKYNEFGTTVDTVSKLPILACSLAVGDYDPEVDETDERKYCIERLDLGQTGVGLFEWRTLANLRTLSQTLYNDPDAIQPYFTIGINPSSGSNGDYLIGQSFEIQNNINYMQNLGCAGTGIPIKASDSLAGNIDFKILGPYNTIWGEYTKTKPSFWNHANLQSNDKVLLENIQSIMISDLKIEAKSDNGLISEDATTADNDLVYASDMNPTYIDKMEDSIKICTPLTLEECNNYGIKYQISNSYIYKTNNNPFYGFGDAEPYIKPEHCLVDYYYNEYSTPAKMISTGMKAASLTNGLNGQQLTNEMMRCYFSGIYPSDNSKYRIMKYETDLKYKVVSATFREYRTYNHTQI